MVSKWCQTSNGVALTLENSGIEHMNLHSMIECLCGFERFEEKSV